MGVLPAHSDKACMVRTMVNRHTVNFADQDMHFFASDMCAPNNLTRSKRGAGAQKWTTWWSGLQPLQTANIRDIAHWMSTCHAGHISGAKRTTLPEGWDVDDKESGLSSMVSLDVGTHEKDVIAKLRVRGCRNSCRNGDRTGFGYPARILALRGVRVFLRRSTWAQYGLFQDVKSNELRPNV